MSRGGYRARWAAVAATFGVGLALGAGNASATPVLAGKTSVSARETAAMVVSLPRDLSYSAFSSSDQLPQARFEGGSTWSAVALYALKDTGGKYPVHPTLVMDEWEMGSRGTSMDGTLPAGDYLLLLTSTPGRAVRVEMSLPTLDGSTVLTPTVGFPLRHRIRGMRPSRTEENTVVVSAMHPTRGESLGAMLYSSESAAGWTGRSQECDYLVNRDDEPTDGEPGCPGGYVGGGLFGEVRAPWVNVFGGAGHTSYSWSLHSSEFGIGWNFNTMRGEPPKVELESWWIDFADMPRELLEPPVVRAKKVSKRTTNKSGKRKRSCRRAKPKSRASAEASKKRRSKRCPRKRRKRRG